LLTDHTKKELEKAAENICKINKLQHVYFTQRFGKRRHFIAGYGKKTFTQTRHLDTTENIALSWEGNMTEEKAWITLRPLTYLLNQTEQELNQS
jgi:hypothetical protein